MTICDGTPVEQPDGTYVCPRCHQGYVHEAGR
jgi:hypothetical protein